MDMSSETKLKRSSEQLAVTMELKSAESRVISLWFYIA